MAVATISVNFASNAEALNGVVSTKSINPVTLNFTISSYSASLAEALAGVLTSKFISPATLIPSITANAGVLALSAGAGISTYNLSNGLFGVSARQVISTGTPTGGNNGDIWYQIPA